MECGRTQYVRRSSTRLFISSQQEKREQGESNSACSTHAHTMRPEMHPSRPDTNRPHSMHYLRFLRRTFLPQRSPRILHALTGIQCSPCMTVGTQGASRGAGPIRGGAASKIANSRSSTMAWRSVGNTPGFFHRVTVRSLGIKQKRKSWR